MFPKYDIAISNDILCPRASATSSPRHFPVREFTRKGHVGTYLPMQPQPEPPYSAARMHRARLLGCSAAQLLGCSAALLHDCSAALLLGCSAHEYSAAQLMAARLHDRVPATRHSKKVSGVLGKGQYACWDREVVDLTIILKGGATGGETMCVSWGPPSKGLVPRSGGERTVVRT